ncbi:unnamed protein product [Ilex paraguariensis]|uniref:Uncharacterized protein n=1 Tax=Ilex paraguariensis TaxID=185542 RepID=A0ABC8UTZ0_9AQUA
MENSAAVELTVGGDWGLPEGTRVCRRLVQSTLFPHKSQDNGKESVVKEEENCGGEDDQEEEEEEEEDEYCGSQSDKKKRKRKSKPKAKKTPQSRAPKKMKTPGQTEDSKKVNCLAFDGNLPNFV